MIIDPSGRGPSRRQLLVAGVVGLAVLVAALWMLMLRYEGDFTSKITVTANLTTTGDGLPSDADVKYRGILVGSVKKVSVASLGELQHVTIDLKPEFASNIPDTVTARVIPANVFAITAVELLDNGSGPSLRSGAEIPQDTSKPTVQLQTTLTTVRNVLAQIDPTKLGRILGTLSYALEPSGRLPGSTIERLDHWVTTMRAAIPNFGGDLDKFAGAANALNQSAPQLVDALGDSVKAARTIADRRVELEELITGSGGAVTVVNNLFAANPNVGKQITDGLNQTFGALAGDPGAIPATMANLNSSLHRLDTTFRWGPRGQMVWRAGVSFSPFTPYTRKDCPRYGDLVGPSCANAPLFVIRQPLPPQLRPHSLTGVHYASPDGTPMPTGPALTAVGPQVAAPFVGTPLAGFFGYAAVPAPPAAAPATAAQSTTGGNRR